MTNPKNCSKLVNQIVLTNITSGLFHVKKIQPNQARLWHEKT